MTLLRVRVDAKALDALRRVPDELRRAVRSWVLEGSQRVAANMRQQIRGRVKGGGFGATGQLAASVRAELGDSGFTVGPTVDYAAFVDQPTRPHEIRPRYAKALAFPFSGAGLPPTRMGTTRSGKHFTVARVGTREARVQRVGGGSRDVVFAQVVHHPGTRGMFFIDATVEDVGDDVAEILTRHVDEALQRIGEAQ